jgi:hypothetical protein
MLDSTASPKNANPHYANGCCSRRNPCLGHREIAKRYQRQRERRRRDRGIEPFSFDREREDDLNRIACARYGDHLPENDTGQRFVLVMAHTLGEPNRIRAYIDREAPWYPEDAADALIKGVATKRLRFRADTLASPKWFNIDDAKRQRLGLKTIGAYDVPKVERAKRRRERYRPRQQKIDKAWRQRQRRSSGAKPRELYEATSATKMRPWEAFGVCRRTWERWGKPPPELAVASPSSAYIFLKGRTRRTCDTPRKPRRRSAVAATPAPTITAEASGVAVRLGVGGSPALPPSPITITVPSRIVALAAKSPTHIELAQVGRRLATATRLCLTEGMRP